MARSITIEDLYQFKFLSRPRLSADGRQIAFVVTGIDARKHTYCPSIQVAPVDGGTAKQFIAGNSRSPAWSPDGRWLAYGFTGTRRKTAIKLCNVESGETFMATDPILKDYMPAFDPEGKYLYFLGERILNPVADNLHFEWSFPRGVKPYAIMLQRDLKSPFIPEPKAPGDKEKEKEKDKEQSKEEETEKAGENAEETAEGQDAAKKEAADDNRPTPIVIDLDGITRRAVPFPVAEGLYTRIRGIKGKALYLSFPIEGTINQSLTGGHEPKGRIDSFEFETQKQEFLMDGVSHFDLSRDAKTLLYRSHSRLRVLKAGDKAPRGDSAERRFVACF